MLILNILELCFLHHRFLAHCFCLFKWTSIMNPKLPDWRLQLFEHSLRCAILSTYPLLRWYNLMVLTYLGTLFFQIVVDGVHWILKWRVLTDGGGVNLKSVMLLDILVRIPSILSVYWSTWCLLEGMGWRNGVLSWWLLWFGRQLFMLPDFELHGLLSVERSISLKWRNVEGAPGYLKGLFLLFHGLVWVLSAVIWSDLRFLDVLTSVGNVGAALSGQLQGRASLFRDRSDMIVLIRRAAVSVRQTEWLRVLDLVFHGRKVLFSELIAIQIWLQCLLRLTHFTCYLRHTNRSAFVFGHTEPGHLLLI